MTDYNPEVDWLHWDRRKALPMLYSRTGTGATNVWVIWVDGPNVVVEWGQKGGALQRSTFECEPKNVGRSNATTAAQQARLEAIAKWKKQLKKKYSMTEEATQALNIKPMLAKPFNDRKGMVTYPVDVQPKFDGVRCLAFVKDGRVVLQSRGGDPYDVEHIRKELEGLVTGDFVLDGEIYIHGMSLQNIISLVKRPQKGSLKLNYHVYDCTHLDNQDARWLIRRIELKHWFASAQLERCIREAPTHVCGTEESVITSHNIFVGDGYEGAIIRLHHGLYRFGYRSSELLKLKAFEDAEFEIIGHRRGKGKFLNVPNFVCKTKEGKEFEVTPKGTEEERAEMLKNAKSLYGKMMTVRYMGFSDEGIPKIAVGICIREPGT